MSHEHDTEALLEPPGNLEELPLAAPKDHKYQVMIVCVMLGIAVLFPWNALITAADYFIEVFDNNTAFPFYVSLAYNYPQVPTMALVIFYGPRFSFTSRTLSSLSVFIAMQIFIPLITSIGIDATVSFWLTMGATFVIGAAFAVNFGTILGFAALFPAEYTTAMMSGMGVGGVIVGLLRIITKAALSSVSDGLVISTWIYFTIACAIVAFTMGGYVYMMRLPFTKYYLRKHAAEQAKVNEPSVDGYAQKDEKIPFLETFKKIWVDAFTVFWVFFITLSVFPGITGLIQPTMFSDPDLWFPIIMIFLFQVFDFVGRTWPYFVKIPNSSLWIVSVSRTLFIPLFMLCIVPGDDGFFSNDLWDYGFMIVFAFSNGFIGTWAMAYPPGKVTPQEQERAGMIMSFFLQTGIFTATHFALVLLMILEGTCALPWNYSKSECQQS